MFDVIISTFFAGTAFALTEMNNIVMKRIEIKYFIIVLNK
tara:strand:+ start:309 stop:428 length:120 start_codon:yes stop_codon:yes gene_type:complete